MYLFSPSSPKDLIFIKDWDTSKYSKIWVQRMGKYVSLSYLFGDAESINKASSENFKNRPLSKYL